MVLCRKKQFIRVPMYERYNDQQINQQKKQVGGSQESIYYKKSDYFQTNIYQKQWIANLQKQNQSLSQSELLHKMETNQYDKNLHKENYFQTTNRASYKQPDFKITKQPLYKDNINKTLKQIELCEPDIFKSIYQADFYKKKERKTNSQPIQVQKNTRVRFFDQVQSQAMNKQSQQKLIPQKTFDAKQFTAKSLYQTSYNEKPDNSSDVSSDTEYNFAKKQQNKKNEQPQTQKGQKQKKRFIGNKGILVNKKNQNIIEKIINQNRY